jgi:hypothetical protein
MASKYSVISLSHSSRSSFASPEKVETGTFLRKTEVKFGSSDRTAVGAWWSGMLVICGENILCYHVMEGGYILRRDILPRLD